MNKIVLLILTGALASLTTGCSFLAERKKDFDQVAVKPTPVKIDTPINQTNPTQTGQLSNASTQKKKEPVQKVATLIPPTNPDVRVRTVVRGRPDPFSVVPLTPQITIEQKDEVKPTDPKPVTNTVTNNNAAVSKSDRPVEQVPSFPESSESISEPTPVEVFEPTLAQNVIVSGLYEANGITQLIVQAPDETSRYVNIGERIANGQVLVKSIDKNSSPTPVVILEQSGVEVSKAIGETPEGSS
ncbi:hypothetical protein NIES4102_30360 [Chondrocystis sp. NIES-4102]|nr:hypothetical protein NIES4102_30360 [Chondrocystis sp. NIES-4102]